MRRIFIIISIVGGLTLLSVGLHAEDIQNQEILRGRIIYEAYCIACHGAEGKGDGLSKPALIPPPPDFTDPEVKASLTEEKITDAITNGKPDTQMEGWEDKLPPEEIQSVMEYIQSLE